MNIRDLLTVGISSLFLFSTSIACSADKVDEPMSAYLSPQGFSGAINTPSAAVQQTGSLQLLYSNQPNAIKTGLPRWQDNYLLSVGFFDFAEIGGRVTYSPYPTHVNDLSANVKVSTAPLKKFVPLLPRFAAGIQDVGGGSNNFRTSYVVATEDIWLMRFSLGYGFGPDRMDGLFASGDLRPFSWLHLLAEHDARSVNVGARMVSPGFAHFPVNFMFTVTTGVNGDRSGQFDLAAGLNIPLDVREWNKSRSGAEKVKTDSSSARDGMHRESPPGVVQSPEPAKASSVPADPKQSANSPEAGRDDSLPEIPDAYLLELKHRLEQAGFVHVKVGRQGNSKLVIRYENVTFLHNELDAVGVVSGIAAMTAPDACESLKLIVIRKGIAMKSIEMPVKELKRFLSSDDDLKQGQVNLRDAMIVTSSLDTRDVHFPVEEKEKSLLQHLPPLNLTLWPGLSTFLATDVGVFDYLLSMKPEATLNPWPGALLHARWDIPVAWSENLDDGKVYRSSRSTAKTERVMLSQAFKILPDLMLNIGAGMIQHDNLGTLNEVTWQPGDDAHRFRLMQGWARNDKSDTTNESWLASYRYHAIPFDLHAEVTAGRFWYNDRGYRVDLKRFFGDVAVSVFYKNSTTDEGKHWQVAGLQFNLPLTPRRNIKVGPVVVSGTDDYGYGQETTLAIGGQQTNDVLQIPLSMAPLTATSLGRAYYDRDRFSSAYILKNVHRLRESWIRFGNNKLGK